MQSLALRTLFIVFFVQACGQSNELKSFQLELNLCDPQDNPSACPANLRNDAQASRTLKVGDEGVGIKVDSPNDQSMLEACRATKLTLLGKYIEKSFPYEGLYEGEFIAASSFEIVSKGSECIRRTLLNSCTKRLNFARIVCSFEIFSSPSLLKTP